VNPGTMVELSRNSGIPTKILQNWKYQLKLNQNKPPAVNTNSLTSVQKFQTVLKTSIMDELEIGEFLRKQAITKESLNQWIKACEQANDPSLRINKIDKKQISIQKKKTEQLERELKRKEKALATQQLSCFYKEKSRRS
jgi:hypothetical protein